jgi:hypothetical protein
MFLEGDHYLYQPGGLSHAVDAGLLHHDSAIVLAYALCGAPVRLWRDDHFDPSADHVHDGCLARINS